MRTILFFAYCLIALAGIFYYATAPGGHVATGLIASAAGGWAYPVVFAILALIVMVLAKPGKASFTGGLLGLIIAGGAAVLLMLFVTPAPLGHLALTMALFGLAALMALFSLSALGAKG